MRQIGAIGRKADYRFTTTGRSKTVGCMEPGKCTTILLLRVLETLIHQHVQRFECTRINALDMTPAEMYAWDHRCTDWH